jgi:hypothetical protein
VNEKGYTEESGELLGSFGEEPKTVSRFLRLWTHRAVLWVGFSIICGTSLHFKIWGGVGAAEVLHVALPAAVLFVEFYMLGKMRREALEREEESHQRARVMADLDKFRIALSRGHYIQELERGIRDAKSEILFTSATMATSGDRRQKRLVDTVREKEDAIEKSGGSLIHRGIVAKVPATLPGAVELVCKTKKTEIRFRAYFGYTRLRFQVTDRAFSVIGVVEKEPAFDRLEATHRSFSVESMLLAEALRDRFNKEWDASEDVWTYLDEHIREMLGPARPDESAITKEVILRLLKAEETGVTAEDISPHSKQFEQLLTEAERKKLGSTRSGTSSDANYGTSTTTGGASSSTVEDPADCGRPEGDKPKT